MIDTTTWRSLAAEAEQRLAAAGVPAPAVHARRLVERAADFDPGAFTLRLDEVPGRRSVAHFDQMLARSEAGEPLQYVVGVWSFRTLELMVDPRVLIPRPETEVVVDVVLGELDRMRAMQHRPLRVADLGTGSGAIALSVAVERGRVEVVATDVSSDALAVAGANLVGLGRRATAVRLVQGDWFEALEELPAPFDLIVSNPPYVAVDDDLPAVVRDHEPVGALVAGPSGLEALDHLVRGAAAWLTPDGAIVVELAPHQAGAMAALARDVGFGDVEVVKDLTGRDRIVVARGVPVNR